VSQWHFIGHCFDGALFEIDGINVWSRSWQPTGETASISDPLYHWQNDCFTVYIIREGNKTIEFACGEFSNTVWGFFQRKTSQSSQAGLFT
jgi:hypothetical protein